MDAVTLALAKKYTDKTIEGSGGLKGEDGFSPLVEIEKIENGNRVSITDVNGEKNFDILDGESGVYIGDTEPEDENIKVWIDPNSSETTEKFPNPFSLKFTGATTTEYDGSSEITVNIPLNINNPMLIDQISFTPTDQSVLFDLIEMGKTKYYFKIDAPQTENTTYLSIKIGNIGNYRLSSNSTNLYASTNFIYVEIIDNQIYGYGLNSDGQADGTKIIPILSNPRVTSDNTKVMINLYPHVTGVEKFNITIWGE